MAISLSIYRTKYVYDSREKILGGSNGVSGPCKGPIHNLQGDLVAPTDGASLEIELWINFQYIDQLTINGGGSLDGQGPSAWPYNKYDNNPPGKPLPIVTCDSPNTDGIYVAVLNNIQILNLVIGTRDDCVSIGPIPVSMLLTFNVVRGMESASEAWGLDPTKMM